MQTKYHFHLFLAQIVTILLLASSITANLLEKLAEMASTDVNKEGKQEETGILSMGQYFQDIFSEQLTPFKLEFGHVCENPSEWEQRFERKDFDNNRYSGKVKWGNRNGEYGEQYWDLNH